MGTMLAVSLAGTVLADDVATYPASMCRPQDSGSLEVLSNGGVENPTSSSVTALCPVERKWEDGGWMTKLSGTAWVLDRNTSTNSCCRAVSRNPSGGNVEGTWVCTSGSSTSYQSLSVPQITDTTTFSHFYLECTVPGATGSTSGLLSFKATQE
ncbi:hypothetical protein [Sorangium cellulosum]|nr:hypothetical protein [Sorangium cellulosum]